MFFRSAFLFFLVGGPLLGGDYAGVFSSPAGRKELGATEDEIDFVRELVRNYMTGVRELRAADVDKETFRTSRDDLVASIDALLLNSLSQARRKRLTQLVVQYRFSQNQPGQALKDGDIDLSRYKERLDSAISENVPIAAKMRYKNQPLRLVVANQLT